MAIQFNSKSFEKTRKIFEKYNTVTFHLADVNLQINSKIKDYNRAIMQLAETRDKIQDEITQCYKTLNTQAQEREKKEVEVINKKIDSLNIELTDTIKLIDSLYSKVEVEKTTLANLRKDTTKKQEECFALVTESYIKAVQSAQTSLRNDDNTDCIKALELETIKLLQGYGLTVKNKDIQPWLSIYGIALSNNRTKCITKRHTTTDNDKNIRKKFVAFMCDNLLDRELIDVYKWKTIIEKSARKKAQTETAQTETAQTETAQTTKKATGKKTSTTK